MTKANLKKLYQKEIKKIVASLKPYAPEKIILFGSAVGDNLTPKSDIDLLLIKKTKKSFLQRGAEARSLIDTPIPLDLFVLTPEEFNNGQKNWQPFVIDVLEEGKVIYG